MPELAFDLRRRAVEPEDHHIVAVQRLWHGLPCRPSCCNGNIMNCLQIATERSARSLPACGYVLTETGSSCRADSTLNCLCCCCCCWRSSRTPSGEPVAHYLAGPTWPPGRIWLSPDFLPPCPPERGACPGPLSYRSFLHSPVVQGAGFELVESCGLCFFWLPYLPVLPCCCCCLLGSHEWLHLRLATNREIICMVAKVPAGATDQVLAFDALGLSARLAHMSPACGTI